LNWQQDYSSTSRIMTMRTTLAVLLALVGLGTMGCDAENPVIPVDDLTIQSHFYPILNGSRYTYVRFNNNTYDTVTYQVKVGQRRGDLNELKSLDDKQRVLYYFGFGADLHGETAAVLKDTTTSQVYALAGNLEKDGNPWIAQKEAGKPIIWAKVVERYDEYILPGGLTVFDVIAVKYWPENKTDEYTLRFFAKNYGLVREKRIVGQVTEIGSLQLLTFQDQMGHPVRQVAQPGRQHKFWRSMSVPVPDTAQVQ
jgi:hypothetical protein